VKLRESGMPEEQYWESLFSVELILDRLGIDAALRDVAELGCGYGTFTLPVARRISGVIETCDIEPEMGLIRLSRTSRPPGGAAPKPPRFSALGQ
jgi:SAM-dependent methyltransferase